MIAWDIVGQDALLFVALAPPPCAPSHRVATLALRTPSRKREVGRRAPRHREAYHFGRLAMNAELLRSLIANLDKFSGALARNSDRVDGLISGLERFAGGPSKSAARIYDLAAATSFPGLSKRPQSQVLVPEATTLSIFDSDRVVLRDSADGKPVIDNAQWPDLLPKIIQARLIQSFENAGLPTVIGRAPDGLKIDFQVAVDIRSFSVSASDRAVRVELAVKVFSTEGRIVGSRSFTATKAVDAIDAPAAAAKLAQAFESVAGEIVVWVFGLI